jgi:hypothetical protein
VTLLAVTERLFGIGDVTVDPVSEDRVGDWLRFYDHEAFSGDPDWASCYCLEPHVPATPDLPERLWGETRATVAERLRCGRTFGYLAHVMRTWPHRARRKVEVSYGSKCRFANARPDFR